ncbi:hypothetical protein [Neorhizobium tomejilense]|uniref:hypothetical protein n=1 Tax=Neorhizobium tomejilense TaxID=2093828 RepID=UPI00155EFC20|nr:hypothetical protein [Neorhizobium tomejilense]
MALTEAVIDQTCLSDFLNVLADETSLVADTRLDKSANRIVTKSEISAMIKERFCQFYIKNAAFSRGGFYVEEVENVHMGTVFATRSSGDVFLTVTTLPLDEFSNPAFEVSISYQSSFLQPTGNMIYPTVELKKYYSKIKNLLVSQAERFALFPKRNVWFKRSVLVAEPLAVELLRQRHGGRKVQH